MKLVGQYLKSQRIAKKLSLEQVALVTKISKSTLVAIEEADSAKLPSKSYLRGFVLSYGRYLNSDTEKLLSLFAEEMGSTNPKTQIDVIQKDTWKTVPLINKIQINSKTLIVSGLLVLTGFAFFTKSLVKKYQNEAITLPPQVNNPKVVNLEKKELDVTEETTSPQTTSPSSSEKTVINDKTDLSSPPDNNEVETSAQIAPAVIEQKTYDFASEGVKELIIEAKDPTFIKIKIGDEDSKSIKLAAGEFHTVKAKSKIQFETSNASSVEVIYNGVLQTKNRIGKNRLELTY